MAENVDYLSALLQDNTIDNPKYTPAQYLEGIKAKLIALGAKPGTGEYENAFKSYIGIRNMNQGTFGGGGFEFSTAAKDALDYMKNTLTPAQVKELGIEPSGAFGGLGKQEAFVPGQTLQNPKTFEIVNVADLDTIPDWFNPQSLSGFAEAGIRPGAKVTPAMRAKITELMGGQPGTAGTATTTPGGTPTPTGTGTGVATGYDPVTKTFKASDGRQFTDQQAYATYQATLAGQKAERQSAYDLLYEEFDKYGLGSLVEPLKGLIVTGASPSEFTIELRNSPQYQRRFAANQARVKNGLRALSESEYIREEDAYQEVMRRRGLPPEYYSKGDLGVQKGFESLIAGDVSSTELEDRIVNAQDRVLNANPEIAAQLKQFYPGISNGDILAYALDPANAINNIKRKITAAEIGAAAGTYGLKTTVDRAEQLAGAGVTEATAQQGFKTISQVGPRAGELSQFYKQDPYTQETAEKEFFGLTGAREAEMQRKKLTSLETAAFSGSAGAGAIARDRAGVI
jgi:hypothetical protein